MPGALYIIKRDAYVYPDPEFADGGAKYKFHGDEVLLVLATQEHGTGFSLCLSHGGLMPIVGWVFNDDLRWIDDPEMYR